MNSFRQLAIPVWGGRKKKKKKKKGEKTQQDVIIEYDGQLVP